MSLDADAIGKPLGLSQVERQLHAQPGFGLLPNALAKWILRTFDSVGRDAPSTEAALVTLSSA